MIGGIKTCAKCHAEKSLSEFHSKKNGRDGLKAICKPCESERTSAWYLENKERRNAIAKAWAAANVERVKANQSAWNISNPGRVKATTAKWDALNKDRKRIHGQNRRSRVRKTGGKLSTGLAERLFKLQRGKCACGCGQPLGDDFHLDHIMPLALGGTNTDDNIQLLRAMCNKQKYMKHPIDFMQQKGFLL